MHETVGSTVLIALDIVGQMANGFLYSVSIEEKPTLESLYERKEFAR